MIQHTDSFDVVASVPFRAGSSLPVRIADRPIVEVSPFCPGGGAR